MGTFEIGTDGPSLVVVGIDGSRTSMRAAAYAAGLARRQHSRLVVVHVVHPMGGAWAGTSPIVAGLGPAMREAGEEAATELAVEIRDAAGHVGVDAEWVVRHGDVANELRALADERRADLVVVGSSETSGHRFAGSVALRLVRAGRWPVVVVP